MVFFGLGFDTMSPTVAWALKVALEQRTADFAVLSVMDTVAQDPELAVVAFCARATPA
jgi:hydrogenase maturation factor